MRLERRDRTSGESIVDDALATLQAWPGLAHDPEAGRALEELRARLKPADSEKALRLAHASQLVGASLDLEEVLRSALALAVDVMHAERAFLVLREGYRIAAIHDPAPHDGGLAEEAPARALVERVFASGEPIFTTDAQEDPALRTEQAIVALHLRSIACVPLRVRGNVVGAVYVDSRVIPGLFQPGDRELLVSFAHQAALAIENARLFEQERERAQHFAELQEFQARLLEAIANGVVTVSGNRAITSFNGAAEQTFGLAADAMVGRQAKALARVMPDFPELLDTFYRSGAVLLRAEVEAYAVGGEELTVEIRVTPMRTPEGTGAAIVVTDVTRNRRLELEREAQTARADAIQASFSRYLAPHVVQSLVRDPASVRLGGERKRATMLFADIRGFTAIAASLDPERVVEILNAYFEEGVRIVFELDGLLDKFYGDGLMAVFGPPRTQYDDAARALEAAQRLSRVVREELAPRLNYPLAISIGLATGDVVAGHFGSQRRMDYTVIGDAVNLAHGLQSAAPAGAIYLDEMTYDLARPDQAAFHRMGARIKGRSELITVYAALPEAGTT